MNVPQLILNLQTRAANVRRFVRQLDAPTLHMALNNCADLMEEAARALEEQQQALRAHPVQFTERVCECGAKHFGSGPRCAGCERSYQSEQRSLRKG